jgi:hypothetical protein
VGDGDRTAVLIAVSCPLKVTAGWKVKATVTASLMKKTVSLLLILTVLEPVEGRGAHLQRLEYYPLRVSRRKLSPKHGLPIFPSRSAQSVKTLLNPSA